MKPDALEKLRAEAAVGHALGIEIGSIEAWPYAGGTLQDFQKQVAVPVLARCREPLHFVLIRIGVETEQLRHTPIELTQRIRRVQLLVQAKQLAALGMPARATAKIAMPVEHQHGRILEGRRIVCRRRVRTVMVNERHPAVGETRP
jgi:hypothetical protein